MKRYIFLPAILLYLIFVTSFCYAAAGNATKYKITVKSVQLLTEGGSWITIASPNQEIDIASASAGATAGEMMSNSKIPPGKYVNFRMILSNVMKVAGTDSGTNTTKSGGTITITGTSVNGASTTTWVLDPGGFPAATLTNSNTWQNGGTPPGEITATLNLGAGAGYTSSDVWAMGTNNLTTPIEVKDNSSVSIYFQFDTQSTVYYEGSDPLNKTMYFVPPSGGTTFGITVDGVFSSITAASMKTDFNK